MPFRLQRKQTTRVGSRVIRQELPSLDIHETMATRKRTADSGSSKTSSVRDMSEENISKEEKEMSLGDKLDYIDQEIRKLHVFCVNSGYSSSQIEKFVDPFSKSVSSAQREGWMRRAIQFAVFVAVTAAIFHIDPAYKLMCVLGRKGVISILPVWDWTQIYHQNCLINNPLYSGGQLTSEDCEICEGMRGIRRVSNVSQQDMLEKYLKRDMPVIVEDGTRGWPTVDKYSIAALAQMYKDNPDLREHDSCLYASNLRGQYKDHRALLNKAQKGGITEFFAHWENCFSEAAKVLRHLYKRPYFFPPTVEVAINNWVFIASKYQGKKAKTIDMGHSMLVLAQVKGTTQVAIKPREPCNNICEKMTDILKEGEIFVVTDMLWSMSYIPRAEDESITIGFGGSFD